MARWLKYLGRIRGVVEFLLTRGLPILLLLFIELFFCPVLDGVCEEWCDSILSCNQNSSKTALFSANCGGTFTGFDSMRFDL